MFDAARRVEECLLFHRDTLDDHLAVVVWAAFYDRPDFVEHLLNEGSIDINSCQSSEEAHTALMIACVQSRTTVVRQSLKYAAIDIDAQDKERKSTALMLATERGHAPCVRLLLDAGGNASLVCLSHQSRVFTIFSE